jgi:drug/metabolite transporter (DMT)-like permease
VAAAPYGWHRLSTVWGRGTPLGVEGPLILAAVLIGLNFVAIKVAVESIPPLLVGALRFTLGDCCSWLICG